MTSTRAPRGSGTCCPASAYVVSFGVPFRPECDCRHPVDLDRGGGERKTHDSQRANDPEVLVRKGTSCGSPRCDFGHEGLWVRR